MYHNTFKYDANGSMLKAMAKNIAGQTIDNQTYHHQTDANGDKLRNRTYAITDSATITSGNDLLDQTPFDNTALTINSVNNYSYTEIGERKSNKQDSIDLVIWTVYGKIKEIYRTPGSTKKNIKFDYDASGNRVAKHVFNSDSTWVRSEYYIRDAQGNIMSTYQHNIDSTMHYAQTEKHIYGSSMLGIDTKETEMIGAVAVQDGDVAEHALGYKHFTGNNHLGNVLTTFTDRKIFVDLNTDNIIDEYWPDVISSSDYAPFGAYLTERTFNQGTFPNSFNGKREDKELNLQDYGMRPYNPMERELGWMIDALAGEFPFYTPYQFASNSPIISFDIDGLESSVVLNKNEIIIDTKEESQAIVAAKYGKNPVERSNPSVYFQNRQNEAVSESRAVLDVVKDGLIIAGAVTTVVLTAGAGAPIAATIVGTLSGSFGAAAGAVKLVADISGNQVASQNVPTSYFGGMTMMLELTVGDNKHFVSGIVSLVEGVYTWNPTDVKSLTTTLEKAGYTLDAINNIVDGVQLTDQFINEFFPNAKKTPDAKSDSKKTEKKDINTETKLSKKEVEDIRKFLKNLDKTDSSKTKNSKKSEKKDIKANF